MKCLDEMMKKKWVDVVDEWMKEWMNERTNDWANKRMNEGTHEPINEWVNEWCNLEIKQLELEDDDFQGSHSEVLLVAVSFQGCICQMCMIGDTFSPTEVYS